jgi:2-haloacid dehalogenase
MAARMALFDLGRVLIDWEPARLYDKIFDTPAARDRFLGEVCTMAWHTRHDAGVSFADNAADLIAKFPQFESEIGAWGGRWMEMFNGTIDGTARIVERLAARGVPIYALTNMPAETWPLMLTHFPVLERFERVIVSGEIGLVKPDPAIFKYALTIMGDPEPNDVFFIDDIARNIEVASALDFRTHLFRSAVRLEADLYAERLF